MAPILHCVRHAQGYHNLSKDDHDPADIPDPDLTKRGREQCERLREDFPFQDEVDCIMASPIRRTIQTALIGFEPAIKKRGLRLILAPRAQETTSRPSDTGSDLSKLVAEFGDQIDTHRMVEGWNTNQGEWKMDIESIEKHVIEIRRVIKALEYKHVVLVTHGGFLHYFTEDWSDCPGAEGETGWVNTEFRTYEYLDGPGAHLRETKESIKRRAKKPAGGFLAGNGPHDQE